MNHGTHSHLHQSLLAAARSAALALIAVVLFATASAPASNLLVNPSFENNSGHVIPNGWTRFAPTNAQPFGDYSVEGNVAAHSGNLYWKQWGAAYAAGQTNVAGIYQVFTSGPGAMYRASGWFYTGSQDVLGPNCKTWLEVVFQDAGSNVLALYKSDDFTVTAGADTWIRYDVNQVCDLSAPLPPGDFNFPTYAVAGTNSLIVAPIGTTQVIYRYVYSQALQEGGSVFFDDARLDQSSGPSGGVVTLCPVVGSGQIGYVQVHVGPAAAVSAGAKWGISGQAGSSDPNFTVAVNNSQIVRLEFSRVDGWWPPNAIVAVTLGTLTTLDVSYTVVAPRLEFRELIGLGITGTLNTSYRLERRSNPASGNWLAVITNTLGPGFNLLLPWPLTNGPTAFYRAVWLP
jgi:hypothetical protein